MHDIYYSTIDPTLFSYFDKVRRTGNIVFTVTYFWGCLEGLITNPEFREKKWFLFKTYNELPNQYDYINRKRPPIPINFHNTPSV